MRRLLVALGAAMTLVLVLAGCGSSDTASQPVETTTIDMPKSYRFEPKVIQVKAGSTVSWTNSDNFTHSVRLVGGSEGEQVVKPGESLEITFAEPGEYRYDCSFHPHDMKGTVIVTE